MNTTPLPDLPFSAYNGGRFSYLLKEPFARELWEYLSDRHNISRMIDAIDKGTPPITPLLATIEERFGSYITSGEFPDDDAGVMVNNMILQIMDYTGYEHIACGILREGTCIKLSGVYQKKQAGNSEQQ